MIVLNAAHAQESAGKANPLMSIIIPLRANDNIDVLQRLSWKSIPERTDLEVLVVDDGSRNASEIENFCATRSWRYVFLSTQDAPFSLSRARNAGIKHARGEYLYFEDVDFLHRSDFYTSIISLTSSFDEVPFNFASVPTLFLNEASSTSIIENIDDKEAFDKKFNSYINRLQFINPDQPNDLCDSYALMGSNIIVKRDLCFHVGLYDEFFNGWGGEDRDFIYRLLTHNSKLIRPDSFSATKNWKPHRTNAYEGWRAAYRLHGDWLKCLGIYAVHIHHPENTWKDPDVRRFNFEYAERKAVEIVSGTRKMDPVPLSDGSDGLDLNVFVGRNPVFFNDQVMQFLRNVKVVDPIQTISPQIFAANIIADKPARVFFQNPYGNEWLRTVWTLVQEQGVMCICAERGALPWSIYFDAGGFCNDSDSYDRANWEKSQPVDAKAYMENLRVSSQYLEPQGNRKIDELVRRINPEKKTVLVLLQSLTDTTTRHFCDPLGDYSEFLSLIKSLDAVGDFNLLIKNHPLNKVDPVPGAGISVDSYLIYDLYDVCDVVLTLNSGAGLLALGAGKPVINCGTSYYAQPGLALQASSLGSVIKCIETASPPLKQDIDSFFGFLINDFYSFANWEYDSRDASDKTKLSLMRNIRFQTLRVNEKKAELCNRPLDRFSLIMDPFAHHTFLQKQKAPLKKPAPVKSTGPASSASDEKATLAEVRQSDKLMAAASGTIVALPVPNTPFSALTDRNPDTDFSAGQIKNKALFGIYKSLYKPFLAAKQRDRLANQPVDFFSKAAHPVSRLGKSLFLK